VTAWIVSAFVSVGLAVVVGWALPAWAIRRLLPLLEGAGHLVTNYRGRRIPTGLGLVWLVWAAGAGLVGALVTFATASVGSGGTLSLAWLWSAPIRAELVMPLLLIVGSMAFGLVDDVFGGSGVKGFRGHLRELAAGRLSTGGLKLVGIGLLALVAGSQTLAAIAPLQNSATSGFNIGQTALGLVGWACASLVIALAANFVNLTDLRPGRAIKVYGLLAAVGCVWAGLAMWQSYLVQTAAAQTELLAGVPSGVWAAAWFLCLAVLVFGPVLAVWRFDVGESAMLGDAGANAMGALAGFLLVWRSPLWVVAVLAVVLFALNLASERVSFSAVIERVAFLKWVDGLGRSPDGPEGVTGQDDGTRAGGPVAEGDDAGRDGRS
jgi:UDP-GlcNAc:undecaprenyl-phosphate GlcNAc-1-phosphate transferase